MILLDLRYSPPALVLVRQWISEEIWGSIQFFSFLCGWNLWTLFRPLVLYLSWYFDICQCLVTKINETTMWNIGLEEIKYVSTTYHTMEWTIKSSRRCTRVFLLLWLKFTYDKRDFLHEVSILLSLVILGTCGRGATVERKPSVYSFLDVTHPGPLIWLVVDSNFFIFLTGKFHSQFKIQASSCKISSV